jgi:hypothetical protein
MMIVDEGRATDGTSEVQLEEGTIMRAGRHCAENFMS